MKLTVITHKAFRFINIFSLDVVTGSILTAYFAARLLHVAPSAWWYIILAMAVWVVYTADHLLDALMSKENTTILRHAVHYSNRNIIIPIWIGVAVVTLILAFSKLDPKVIKAGVALGLASCIYFAILFFNRKRTPWLLQKELFIALVYTVGIWMVPVIWHAGTLRVEIVLIICNMFILAWAESVLISWFEMDDDLWNNHPSFSLLFGYKRTKYFMFMLLFLSLSIAMYGFICIADNNLMTAAFLIQLLMFFIFVSMILFRDFFKRNQLYRYVGELTFLLPGLIILA